jgi:hypothetical protein
MEIYVIQILAKKAIVAPVLSEKVDFRASELL